MTIYEAESDIKSHEPELSETGGDQPAIGEPKDSTGISRIPSTTCGA